MVLAITVARRVASKRVRLNLMVQSDSDANGDVKRSGQYMGRMQGQENQ